VQTIVCFGDSLTNGARDELHRTYPFELTRLLHADGRTDWWCLNHGVNGETTSHMAERAYAVLAPNRGARFVLFLGGTNDTKVPLPPGVYRENVEAIVTLALTLSIEPVLGLLPPVYGPGLPCYSQVEGNRRIALYNEMLTDLVAEHKLRSCDFRGYSADLYSDGIHLNHDGYVRMAHDWYQAITGSL